MKIYHGIQDKNLKTKPRSIAIGIFDGIHLGHRKILSKALVASRNQKTSSMVVTFEPHPSKVLKPGKPLPILMSLEHRLKLLADLGFKEVLVIDFTKKFSKIPHTIFLKKILLDRLGMKSLSVGHDFRFGYRGQGDEIFLRKESADGKFSLSVSDALRHKKEIISSTAIRALIDQGVLGKAGSMLGRPVSVYGTVRRGKGRGKELGFPTANLNPHHETLPPDGVYAVLGFLGRKKLKGVLHVGPRPTFGEKERTLEVHFPGLREDLYGRELELIFKARIRGNRAFSSPQELAKTIKNDVQKALKILC